VTLLQLRKPFGMSLYPRASSTLSNSLRNMLRLTFSVSLKQVLRISLRYDKIVTTYAEAPRTLLWSLRSCSMTSRCFDSCRDFEGEEDKALLDEEKRDGEREMPAHNYSKEASKMGCATSFHSACRKGSFSQSPCICSYAIFQLKYAA
jgi:hypothetical protein